MRGACPAAPDLAPSARRERIAPGWPAPTIDGRLALGTWQQIVLVDFDDRPRKREVTVHVVGE